jgi:ABC-type Fe3+ transport system substrate-binding protein
VQADLFDGISNMIPLKRAGIVAPYVPPSAALYPTEMNDKDGYWFAILLYVWSPGINTQMVPKEIAPKTYQDLLSPRWKGRMAWNPSSIAGAQGFVGNILMSMGEQKGMEYLRALAEQQVVNIEASSRAILDQVIAGEYPIGLLIYTHHVQISREKGAKADWIKMEPLVEDMNIISFVKGAPHPNAGKLLLDFILSEDGQRVLANANYAPANPDIPAKTPGLKPEGGGFKVTNFPRELVADSRKDWLKVYKEIFE